MPALMTLRLYGLMIIFLNAKLSFGTKGHFWRQWKYKTQFYPKERLLSLCQQSLVLEWHLIKVHSPVQYHAFGMPGRPANSTMYLLPVDVGSFPQETTRVLLCFLKCSNRICSLERQNSYFSSNSICWACRLDSSWALPSGFILGWSWRQSKQKRHGLHLRTWKFSKRLTRTTEKDVKSFVIKRL